MPTYEQLRSQISLLSRPETNDAREISWTTGARVVGLSRTHEDRLEIFLVGGPLQPTLRSVRDALQYGPWWHADVSGPAFEANRLLLPALGHFDEVAAFVCTELLKNGADIDLPGAFGRTEGILNLVFERLWISDAALLGLAGELLLIDALCQLAPTKQVAQVVEAWDGWSQSMRDFSWGSLGVEIKTTTASTSTHHVQGTHQVEVVHDEGRDFDETGLLLVSIGLVAAAPHENSFTVPMLTDRIVGRLDEADRDDASTVFLSHVREYGSESGLGYDHLTMGHDLSFARAFHVAFVRGYDMTDNNVSVLRRGDVIAHQFVDAGSLKYVIDLPQRVSGDINPIVGLMQTATAILGSTMTV